jgi:hypothetical protein
MVQTALGINPRLYLKMNQSKNGWGLKSSILKKKKKNSISMPGMVVHTYNPTSLGGRCRITI